MTSEAIWIGLAVIAVIAFAALVVWWGRTTTPSTDNETTPSQPPAGPGAEGMRVAEPGDITPGPAEDGS